ncbi:MAG: hypothetical protein QOJ83_2234, partial [Frankiales bacterium]|nr:hypothetical protein [Frankiales bacterium]
VADDAATEGTTAEAGASVRDAPLCRPVSLTWAPTRPTAHQAMTAMTAAHTAQTITCPARRANSLASIGITERLSAADGFPEVKNMTMT